jgi:putative sugar O-methyltransferase
MNINEYNNLFNKLKTIQYKEQDHWNVFDQKYYNIIENLDNLKNFRNNGISNMLETGLPYEERFNLLNNNKCYNTEYNNDEIEDIKNRFNELKIMLGDEINNIPFNNNIGNPRHYIFNNCLLNFDDLYHIYATWQLKRFIDNQNIKIEKIVEIGGGYGNFSNKCKTLFPHIKYIIIDLPEVLLLQHYYLSSMNSKYKIINLIDNSIDIDIENDKYDFLLIPYNIYNNYNFTFDVIVNKRSLGEMPKIVLEDYFKWIQKNIKKDGLFYLVNRYVFTKSKDKNKIRDYPFDENWNILLSQPQWLQTHLHEFLLQRTEKPNISLQFLLKSFPLHSPPNGPIMKF